MVRFQFFCFKQIEFKQDYHNYREEKKEI